MTSSDFFRFFFMNFSHRKFLTDLKVLFGEVGFGERRHPSVELCQLLCLFFLFLVSSLFVQFGKLRESSCIP